MYIKASTLDDLLEAAYRALKKSKTHLTASKGSNVELSGIALELTRPRARLSRSTTKGHVFSCFGELFWYLSASNDLNHIKYYLRKYGDFAEKNGTVWGAYGPRVFGGGEKSQYNKIKELLKKKSSSRQAVIQIFDKKDIQKKYKDVPCTCTLQFLARNGILTLVVHMRSNDAFIGLPHDIFAFTMLQEILARDLGLRLGPYKHLVGSFHLYDTDRNSVEQYLEEGYQATKEMPEMPPNSQWPDIDETLRAERILREEGTSRIADALKIAQTVHPYWSDIIKLLSIFAITKNFDGNRDQLRQVLEIRDSMSAKFYADYIRRKAKTLDLKATQMELLSNALLKGAAE